MKAPRRLVYLLLIPALLYAAARMNLQEIARALARTRLGWLAAAMLCNVALRMGARICSAATLLATVPRGGEPIALGRLSALTFASHALRNLLAGPVGSAMLTVELHREGYRLEGLLATQIFERVADVISLGILTAPVLALCAPPVPLAWAFGLATAAGALLLASVAAFSVFHARLRIPEEDPSRGRVARAALRLLSSLKLVHEPGTWLPALGWSIATHVADALGLGACCLALGLHVGWEGWLMTFAAIRVAIAIPLTPGQIGVLEAGAALALTSLGTSAPDAIALALLYRAVRSVPIAAVGLALNANRAAAAVQA